MTALSSIPDLYLPRKQPPSKRDREIYRAVVCEVRRQQEVAQEFGVSQPRVAQIVKQVASWVEQAAPRPLPAAEGADAASAQATDEPAPRTPEEQLRLAEYVVGERLEFVYGQSIHAWRKSQADLEARRTRLVGEERLVELTTKTQSGKVGFLNQAMRAALALGRLQGVDVMGKEARKRAEEERAGRERREADAIAAEHAGSKSPVSASPADAEPLARTTYNAENRPENGVSGATSDLQNEIWSEEERVKVFLEALGSAA